MKLHAVIENAIGHFSDEGLHLGYLPGGVFTLLTEPGGVVGEFPAGIDLGLSQGDPLPYRLLVPQRASECASLLNMLDSQLQSPL